MKELAVAGSSDKLLQVRGILAMLCAALVLVFAYQSASEAANAASTQLRTQDVSVLAATCVTCHAPTSEAGIEPTPGFAWAEVAAPRAPDVLVVARQPFGQPALPPSSQSAG